VVQISIIRSTVQTSRAGVPDELLLRTLATLPFVEPASLSGASEVLFGEPAVLLQLGWAPTCQGEYEVSAAGFPIFYASRIAGCLLLSSTQPNYFLPPSRPSLIQGYTNLVALAFEPEDFYPHTLVDLRVMPPLHVQQTYFAGFRQRIRKRMQESLTTQHPLKLTLAERLVWQELEEIFLQLPHPAT